jgi:hypothetical protein
MPALPVLCAVELNDAGVVLARRGVDGAAPFVSEASPGVALLQDGTVQVGEVAARRQRVAPLQAQNRFWQALGLDPLPWRARGIATYADLAHAHLSSVVEPAVREGAEGLLLAVPPGYTREQLGLLVGVANESGLALRGLVDLGLAACASVEPAPHTLHLDLQLHQAVATSLEFVRSEGMLRRSRYEILPGAGVGAFLQAMVARVATAFVQQTRFDPLHEAATEQGVYDKLPVWLAALETADETTAVIDSGNVRHEATLQRAELIAAAERVAGDVLRLVQSTRPAGLAMQLCLTPWVVRVPGLLARLASLRDCRLTALPHGAAALGALAAADAIVRPPDSLALVHRLAVAAPVGADAAVTLEAVPAEAVPTHVLFRGRAWPITAQPLTLGWSVSAAPRVLSLPAGIGGVSKTHCVLRNEDGQSIVEDRSTYGTFVNDERVAGRVALRTGDVLRLGAPGIELELIRVLPEHAAPS